MNTCKMTIEGILRRNGLEEPDGRQLCIYRHRRGIRSPQGHLSIYPCSI